ncbi:hypothetical protein CONCODRAFT_16612 [Conidiobolus coronatus NRRL 28638]|uniref:Uncharacterized protein n=1 Tax=Conidiobolus coronatus (strain ATCC 28846 / CBS 209.66 / NRRL 28638) TaxID=796925 RepID=A0A137PA39_CONC2|nr:hypothetical protein CONCODRAFT_16612 [Conidiobolus coronatus NRRL 28638]|eukprot:KXN71866.1 hypothetical protein CONCODRAFT_16612 [Conidiobolus coronatus NRRL 28638]
MVLNYTVLYHLGVRFEWLILCALMIRSGSRAWELSPVVFMFWILVYITSNILLWLAITLDKYFFNTNLHDFYYLCDFILYIYSISKILDYTLISWILSLGLVVLSHYCSRILPEYNFSTSVCAHAMAFAFYLCTSETLVQVIFQKNKSYSNPVLGFDRTDLVHNYRYLVMSGKLHPISLPNHYQNESSHFGKWYQTKPVRGAGLELQSSSDQILWPNGEAILDSFELCVAGIESNSIHLSWSLPMSLLYPLSRSKTLMKEASEQDRLLLNISLPLNPNELMTHPIHPSCVDKNDIIVRLDDIVYRDWNYDPHTNSLLVFGLQPLCNYVFTVSILGFRSMKCYTTTLPETLDTLSIDNTDNQTHSDINQVINIQRQVDEARRLKKEEQSNLKKLKRDKTQLESRTQTLLGQTLKSIQRLQLEEGQLIQKIQKFKDEILSGENWIESSDDLRKELEDHKESLLAQVEVKKAELAIEHEKLAEVKKQLSELQTKYQKEHDLFISSIKDTKESLHKLQAEIKTLESSKQTLIETTIPLIQTQIQHKKDLFGQLTWCKDYIKRLKKKSTVGSKEPQISEEILPLKEDLDNWISSYKSKVDGLRNTTQELKTTVASEEAFCERLEEELEKIQKKKKSDTK